MSWNLVRPYGMKDEHEVKLFERVFEQCHINIIVLNCLDARSVMASVRAGFRWPTRRAAIERWGRVAEDVRRQDEFCYLRQAWILYIHFSDPHEVKDVLEQLSRRGGFAAEQMLPVEVLIDRDEEAERPTYWRTLEQYDPRDVGCVIVSSDVDDEDLSWIRLRDALGNWLTEFLATGGSVIQVLFSLCDGCHLRIGGKWEALACDALVPSEQGDASHLALGRVDDPLHPILRDVHVLDGGPRSFHALGAVPKEARVVASWSNGVPLVVERPRWAGGSVIGLNMLPISSNAGGLSDTYWDDHDDDELNKRTNDASRLFCNAVFYGLVTTFRRRGEVGDATTP